MHFNSLTNQYFNKFNRHLYTLYKMINFFIYKMIKKLKNNLKALNKKESSLLDFVLEINQGGKLKGVQFSSKENNNKYSRAKEKDILNFPLINGHSESVGPTLRKRTFAEDKENKTKQIVNFPLTSIQNAQKTDRSIKNYFKPDGKKEHCVLTSSHFKVKKIEFFDEENKKFIKMNQCDEKDVEFTKSKILPKVKMMKVDNDVMTDDEQLKDALSMMRNNLKDTIKQIMEKEDYLNKNLSRKITFVGRGRK